MTFLLAAYLAAWSIVEQRVALASTQGAALSGLALRQYREAPEFLPRGSSIGYDEEDRADPSTVRLPALGGAEAVAAGAAIGPVRPLPDGGLRLTVATAGPTLITVRRHYFPGWIARNLATGDLAEVRPNGPLAAWKVPAGRHDFELRRGPAPFERLGWIVSAISLIILAAGLWLTCYSGLAVTRRNTSSTGS